MGVEGTHRNLLQRGLRVRIVLKKDQHTGKLTEGVIKDILTSKDYHPRGIKVRLLDDSVGRVQEIVDLPGGADYEVCID